MGDNYQTPLISSAIEAASRTYPLSDDAVFHSDRGSNYTSAEFGATLAALGIAQSVGRTGSCFDNAMAESFFAVLKNELVHRTVYPTREHARKDIARYIQFRYNTRRIHSALGYRTPQEVYDEHLNRAEAALDSSIKHADRLSGNSGAHQTERHRTTITSPATAQVVRCIQAEGEPAWTSRSALSSTSPTTTPSRW